MPIGFSIFDSLLEAPRLKTWLDPKSLRTLERLILDTWFTQTSRDMVQTLKDDCVLLHQMQFFNTLPELKLFPELETLVHQGTQKVLEWSQLVLDRMPRLIQAGLSSASSVETSNTVHTHIQCSTDLLLGRQQVLHKYPLLESTRIVLGYSTRDPLLDAFPGLQACTSWTFLHEAAHANLFKHLLTNPMATQLKHIDVLSESQYQSSLAWTAQTWTQLFTAVPSVEGSDVEALQNVWNEYYADVGASLLYARKGYTSDYLDKLRTIREQGDVGHQTQRALARLQPFIDMHPIVLNEVITDDEWHLAISECVAPEICYDLVNAMHHAPEIADFFEDILPDLPGDVLEHLPEYQAYNQASYGLYPKLSFLMTMTFEGPEVEDIGRDMPVPDIVYTFERSDTAEYVVAMV